MHPYSVWLKDVVIALVKDVKYANGDADVVSLCDEILNVLCIEIEFDDVRQELTLLSADLKTINTRDHGTVEFSDFRRLQEIGNTLRVAQINTACIARIYNRCRDLLVDSNLTLASTIDEFDNNTLNNLMQIPSDNAVNVVEIFQGSQPGGAGSADVESDSLAESISVDREDSASSTNGEDLGNSEDRRRALLGPHAWPIPYLVAGVAFLVLLYIDYKISLDWFNWIDAAVGSILVVSVWWAIFNPRTRFMRMFGAIAFLWVLNKGLAITTSAGYFNENVELMVTISSYTNSAIVEIFVGLILLVLLVLDYLERSRAS